MLNTARLPTMLALRYFSLSLAGVSQSSFSTSWYQAKSGSLVAGSRSQNSRSAGFGIIRMNIVICSQKISKYNVTKKQNRQGSDIEPIYCSTLVVALPLWVRDREPDGSCGRACTEICRTANAL